MENIKYIVYKEGLHYVSQSLNVDVSSFGDSKEEATNNLKEALELFFEDDIGKSKYQKIGETFVGEIEIHL